LCDMMNARPIEHNSHAMRSEVEGSDPRVRYRSRRDVCTDIINRRNTPFGLWPEPLIRPPSQVVLLHSALGLSAFDSVPSGQGPKIWNTRP
jgi:hypothetical protein